MPNDLESALRESAASAPPASPDLVARSLERRRQHLRRRKAGHVLSGVVLIGVATASVAVVISASAGNERTTDEPVFATPDQSGVATMEACPSEDEVDELKASGTVIEPCDPYVEGAGPTPNVDPGDAVDPDGPEVCPSIMSGKASGLHVRLPCAVGAKIVESRDVRVNDEWCARVTYVAKQEAEPVTETLCVGDRPRAGGPPVRGPH
jgi:hypothetical protein